MPSLYATGVSEPNPLHTEVSFIKYDQSELVVPIQIPSVVVAGLNAGNIPAGTFPF